MGLLLGSHNESGAEQPGEKMVPLLQVGDASRCPNFLATLWRATKAPTWNQLAIGDFSNSEISDYFESGP